MDMQVQAETGMRLFSYLKKYHLTLNPFSVCAYICIFVTEAKQLIQLMSGCIIYYEKQVMSRLLFVNIV